MRVGRLQFELGGDGQVVVARFDAAPRDVVDGVDAVSFDQQKAKKDLERSTEAPANSAKVKRLPNQAKVYHIMKGDKVESVVIPIEGYGLWSTLYGFLALDADTKTVRGITFYEHGETPGLGGEEGDVVADAGFLTITNLLLSSDNFETDFDALELLNGKRYDFLRTPTRRETDDYADGGPVTGYDMMARTLAEQRAARECVAEARRASEAQLNIAVARVNGVVEVAAVVR